MSHRNILLGGILQGEVSKETVVPGYCLQGICSKGSYLSDT